MKLANERQHHSQRILPGSTIGVLGGGQLGRMMALAGKAMGYRFITLDPQIDCPCAQVADNQIVAGYDDVEAAEKLASSCDVITYEFENVNSDVTAALSRIAHVPQGSDILYTTQHRLREKAALERAGVPVAPYRAVESEQELRSAVQELGYPSVLKTVTGGYDGKGQFVIKNERSLEEAVQWMRQASTVFVLEKFVPFIQEISVIAARNGTGELRTFLPAENIHLENILHLSIVPARTPDAVLAKATELARRIAESVDIIGLIAVEMFVCADNTIVVNELAPRPHNSGHYTIEACKTSQFEQHVRAICNLPLGSTDLLSPAVMVNVLGEHVEPLQTWLANSPGSVPDLEIKVHLYGKKEIVAKRKMGHVNILTDDVNKALSWIEQSGIWQSTYAEVER